MVVFVAALVLGSGLAGCQPQPPGGVPSACFGSLTGSVRGGNLVSGRSSATMSFPAGAQFRVTGTVTNVTSLFGAVMSWRVDPFLTGTTSVGQTTSVDTTWTSGAEAQDMTIHFNMNSLFTSGYDFDLTIRAAGASCPPGNPTDCSKRGGNAFFSEPVVHAGHTYQGCYRFDSCVSELTVDGVDPDCDEGDDLLELMEEQDGYFVWVGGYLVAMAGAADDLLVSAGTRVAPRWGGLYVVAGVSVIVLLGAGYAVPVLVDRLQAQLAIDREASLIQDVQTRNPSVSGQNSGSSGRPGWDLAVKAAMAVCISDIAISLVAANADLFRIPGTTDPLDPESVDPESGMVDLGGAGERHLCELVPVYLPGGATQPGGAAMVESSLHIRDVLYGERNRSNTTPPPPAGEPGSNPTGAQPQWSLLTRAEHPLGTNDREWFTRDPYLCRGTASQGTACDEWPWYVTEQGGPGGHLRVINGSHNSNGGSDLSSFYASSVCNISQGDSFIVVPLPSPEIEAGARSIRLC